MARRRLSLAELALLIYMLRGTLGAERFLALLPTAEVEDIDDGGMGSLRFVSAYEPRKLGIKLASLRFDDEDGVPVLMSLFLDEEGELYELDSWKVDYSPRIRTPFF
jgi:hypothetical protein